MATGSLGGSRIITATLQDLHHHLDLGMSAEEAVYTPHWHECMSRPSTLFEGLYNESDMTFYEAGVQLGIAGYLVGLGYDVSRQAYSGSTSHVIVRGADGVFEAANDQRKSGGGGSAY